MGEMTAPIVTIHLPGDPQGKGRPRAMVRNGKVHTYTPDATRSYEAALKEAAFLAMRGRTPRIGSLAVSIRADMPIPKSLSKRSRADIDGGVLRPTTKPDIDNIAKTIDALNNIVWADDKQVVSLFIEKFYSDRPALTIEVRAA